MFGKIKKNRRNNKRGKPISSTTSYRYCVSGISLEKDGIDVNLTRGGAYIYVKNPSVKTGEGVHTRGCLGQSGTFNLLFDCTEPDCPVGVGSE